MEGYQVSAGCASPQKTLPSAWMSQVHVRASFPDPITWGSHCQRSPSTLLVMAAREQGATAPRG